MSQPKTVREFTGGGTVEELDNGTIKFTTNELTREHVDAYYEEVARVYSEWRRERPIYLLFDVSFGATTSYFRQRAMELYVLARSLPLRTRQAYLASEHHAAGLHKFVKLTGLSNEHKLRIFTDESEARRWLEEDL